MFRKKEKQDLLIEYFSHNGDLIVRNSLKKSIITQVEGKELYGLIREIYPVLNKKYDFDKSYQNKQKTATMPHHANLCWDNLCWDIKSLVLEYHSLEVQQTKDKALKSTLLFCLLIVTIPFALYFYNKKIKSFHEEQNFQELFVDDKYLKAKPLNSDGTKKMYGLLNKSLQNSESDTPKPFVEKLFNKKGEIRKFLDRSEHGFSGRYGINLIGTKTQITDSMERFQNRAKDNESQETQFGF